MRDLKITMTLLVRDEEDIIADNIWFHHAQGVDSFIVTDNLSTDATADIVRSLSRELDIEYVRQTQDDFNQWEWVTDMARRAHLVHGADWVINSDADEFWAARGGNLKSFLAGVSPDIGVLKVMRHNAVVPGGHADPALATCHPRTEVVFEQASVNSLGKPLPGKCLHRACESVVVAQGNHGVTGAPGATADVGGAVRILHYPHRSLRHYKNKILVGGAAYGRNKTLPHSVGETWRDQYKLIESGEVERFWAGAVRPRELITIGLAMQTLFRDTAVADALQAIAERQREQKIQAALTDLRCKSDEMVKEFVGGVAKHIAGVDPAIQPTRPLFYYLQFCLSGPNRHLDELSRLHPPGSQTELWREFPKLRDILSLFPRNVHMKHFLAKLLWLYFPEEVRRLRADCAGKRVILHASCLSRMHQAEASIASFSGQGSEYHHILLVGQNRFRTEDETELSLRYDGQVLAVPIPDNYESLHRKIFYALTILDLVAKPVMVLKLDDDVRLRDGPAFESIVESVISQGFEYAGRKIGCSVHQEQWHGWHVSKCEDPLIDGRGYQYPLPREYAAGGYGYCLGRKGIEACSYMYLAMKEFFAMRTVGLEDVYVGHALYAQGIELHDISPGESLMAMRGLGTGDRPG